MKLSRIGSRVEDKPGGSLVTPGGSVGSGHWALRRDLGTLTRTRVAYDRLSERQKRGILTPC